MCVCLLFIIASIRQESQDCLYMCACTEQGVDLLTAEHKSKGEIQRAAKHYHYQDKNITDEQRCVGRRLEYFVED